MEIKEEQVQEQEQEIQEEQGQEVQEEVNEVQEVQAPKKKPKPLQISLTFKKKSELEMELYNHLQNKFYQGSYIKELLINQMFRERPELAQKYGYTPMEQPPTIQVVATPPPQPDLVASTPEPPTTPKHEVAVEEVEEVEEEVEEGEDNQEEEGGIEGADLTTSQLASLGNFFAK